MEGRSKKGTRSPLSEKKGGELLNQGKGGILLTVLDKSEEAAGRKKKERRGRFLKRKKTLGSIEKSVSISQRRGRDPQGRRIDLSTKKPLRWKVWRLGKKQNVYKERTV